MANENKFLDYSGVTKLWSKIKSYVAGYFSAGDGIKLEGSTFKHTNSVTAVTANGVASSNNVTPSYGNTFNVPHFTYDAQGHITSAGTHTVKIPASDNVDTKVTQNSDTSTNGNIPVLLAYQADPTSGTAQTAKYSSLKFNPSTYTATVSKTINSNVFTTSIDPMCVKSSNVEANKIKGIDTVDSTGADTGGSLELISDNGKNNKLGGIRVNDDSIHLSFFNSSSTYSYGDYGKGTASSPSHELEIKNDGTFKWDGNSILTSADLTWNKLSGKPDSFTPSSHTHGNINNSGQVTNSTVITPASGDYILLSDTSDNNKLGKSIAIGSDTAKYLRNDGTWVTPPGTYSLPTAAAGTKGGIKIGNYLSMSGEVCSVQEGSTSQLGVVKLIDSTSSTSTSLAATAKSVKTAYDLAKSASDKLDNLTSAMIYKGSVASVSNLPTTNLKVGDFYNVTDTGANYAWTGTEWDQTGFMVEFERLTDSEIDAACAAAS